MNITNYKNPTARYVPDRSNISPQRIARIYNPCSQRQEKNNGFYIKVKVFHKGHGLQIRATDLLLLIEKGVFTID